MRSKADKNGNYDWYGEYPEIFCPTCHGKIHAEFWGEGVGAVFCPKGCIKQTIMLFSEEEQARMLQDEFKVA